MKTKSHSSSYDNRFKKALREKTDTLTLNEWLSENKISASLLSKWLGVTALTISRINNNHTLPSKSLAMAIAYLTNDKVLLSDFKGKRKPKEKKVYVKKIKSYPDEPIIVIRYNADEDL